MPEPGIVANAIARPPCAMSLVASDAPGGRPFLRVQLGRIAFEVRDFAAYRSCLGAFRQAHHLARDVFLPPGTERVLSGALAAARDAFFPEPPPPPSGRGRRFRQVTQRSAPIAQAAPRRAASAAAVTMGQRISPMTGPDYPLLTVPGFELYQLAQVATFVADALARHRRAAEAGARSARRAAARDVHAGRLALARATGTPDLAGGPLPRPLDIATFREAEQLHGGLSVGEVEVVSLAALGRSSWAAIGRVAGIGPVGAEVGDRGLADALRSHLLTRPAQELTVWAVNDQPAGLGLDRWADEAATVTTLDPERAQHRVVGAALHGISPQLDRTIERHFRTPAQPCRCREL